MSAALGLIQPNLMKNDDQCFGNYKVFIINQEVYFKLEIITLQYKNKKN